jgi:hypothetical protein
MLLCNMEPLEVFMGYYNKLVPHIYIPEPAVMEVIRKFFIMDSVSWASGVIKLLFYPCTRVMLSLLQFVFYGL